MLYFVIVPHFVIAEEGEGGLFGGEGKVSGKIAIFFLSVGFLYIILKRSYIFTLKYYSPWLKQKNDQFERNIVMKTSDMTVVEDKLESVPLDTIAEKPTEEAILDQKESNQEIQPFNIWASQLLMVDQFKLFYKRTRKYFFFLHASINILAVIAGIIHGLRAEIENPMSFYTGWTTVFFMALISVAGIVMYFRFWPFWETKSSRTLIRWVHRQWLFTILILVFLGIHLSFVED